MNVCLVAQDVGPGTALQLLGSALASTGRASSISTFFGHVKKGLDTNEVAYAVASADVVVVGFPSSGDSMIERAAAQVAINKKVKLAFYADAPLVHRVPWLSFAREHVALCLAQDEIQAGEMHEFFPKARVTITGSPVFERIFFVDADSELVRSVLRMSREERLVLVAGGKELCENIVLLNAMVQATTIIQRKLCKIVFAPHPADGNDKQYGVFIDASRGLLRIVKHDEMSTQQMLVAADVVVTAGSSVGIQAACRRIPVVDYMPELVMSRIASVYGTREWRDKLGIVIKIDGSDMDLAMALEGELRAPSTSMREAQEKHYPRPAYPGVAAEKMAQAILSLL